MSKTAAYYEFFGDGPFHLLLITQLQAFSVKLGEQRVDVKALCEDPRRGYSLQFSLECAQQFVDQHASIALLDAQFQAKRNTVVIAEFLPVRPFRLFVSYSGTVHFEGTRFRVVEFVNELRQSFYFALSPRAYEELLSNFRTVPRV